jgi:hypothetical protein
MALLLAMTAPLLRGLNYVFFEKALNRISLFTVRTFALALFCAGCAAGSPASTTPPPSSSMVSYKNDALGISFRYPSAITLREDVGGVTVTDLLPMADCGGEDPNVPLIEGLCETNMEIGVGEYPSVEALIRSYASNPAEYHPTYLPGIGQALQRIGPRLEHGERSEEWIQQRRLVVAAGPPKRGVGGNLVRSVYEITIEWPRSLESNPAIKESLARMEEILASVRVGE